MDQHPPKGLDVAQRRTAHNNEVTFPSSISMQFMSTSVGTPMFKKKKKSMYYIERAFVVIKFG